MAKEKKQQLPPKAIFIIAAVVVIIVLILLAIPATREKLLEIASTYIEISYTNQNEDAGKTNNQNKTNKVTDDLGDCLAFVTVIDVGQGDAIYISFPDGKDMLIDGGKNNSDAETLLLAYLEDTVTDGFIDYVMLTHTDEDHCGGLDKVFKNYDVGAVYMPYISASYGQDGADRIAGTCSTKVYYDFYTAATTEKYVKDGTELSCSVNYNVGEYTIVGENYTFNAYCKAQSEYEKYYYKSSIDPNDYSPIVICEICGIKFCFTGDADFGVEDEFMADNPTPIDIDILKVGHHGSSSSTDSDFIEYLSPEYALIGVGTGNKYGHPTQAALTRLENENVTVYRTDINGDLTVKIYDDSYSFVFSKE